MSRFTRLAALAALAPAAVAGAQASGPKAASKDAAAPSGILAGVPAPGPRTYKARPTVAAITAGDLMSRLYTFADDSMMGREAGTLGNVKGTDYIAAEVKRLGLVPAGENGTYFQTLPFKTRTVDAASKIVVGARTLAFGTDFALLSGAAVTQANAPVVYGGVLGDTTAKLTADQAAGKLVVLRLGGMTPGAMRALRSNAPLVPGAAAVAIVVPDPIVARNARPTTTFLDDADAQAAMKNPGLLLVSASGAGAMFNAPLDGLAAGTAGTPASLDLHVTITPVAYPARNVVAILPGSDAALKGEYVAVGAHNDHIGYARAAVDHDSIRVYNHLVRPGGAEDQGKMATPEQQTQINADLAAWRAAHPNSMRADSISNGADDDGSGSVSVLEVAEKLSTMKVKPKRSVLFVWHVGEEKGLLGSKWFTDNPTVPRDSVVAQLNMDMVGRGAATDVTGESKDGQVLHGNAANYLQLVGSRRLSTELGDLAEKVNTTGKHGFVFDYSMDANGHPMNIYCRSDHYEYARYGIPIIFFTTGGHSDYHQVTDEPEYIDYPHMARVGNYVADLAVTVANLDHRPVVDHAKPDPKGSCQQ